MIPRARKTGIGGIRDQALLVRLAAPPVDGAANDALEVFLARVLTIQRRRVQVVAGTRSRRKRVTVQGIDVETARRRLGV